MMLLLNNKKVVSLLRDHFFYPNTILNLDLN